MVRGHHQAHLDELAGVARQPAQSQMKAEEKKSVRERRAMKSELSHLSVQSQPVGLSLTCVGTTAGLEHHPGPSPPWRPLWWACQRRWVLGPARHRCLSWTKPVYGSDPTPAGSDTSVSGSVNGRKVDSLCERVEKWIFMKTIISCVVAICVHNEQKFVVLNWVHG